MAKRRLTRRQAWRIRKVQEDRVARSLKKRDQTETELEAGRLGPEQQGQVIAHYGAQLEIESIDGPIPGFTQFAHQRANLEALVTGDHVIWRPGRTGVEIEPASSATASPENAPQATGVILARMERHSELCRPDTRGDLKPVAANIDTIIIVVAPQPPMQAATIDRYLIAAEHQEIEPVILLNKTDLLDADNRQQIESTLALYRRIGYRVLQTSIQHSSGLDELLGLLRDRTCVFVGPSGVGKSSLINALLPGADTRTGELSTSTGLGRHTTTTAKLYHFPAGGDLIDSPGVRAFGLWHMDAAGIARGFRDFEPFLGRCKFRDCSHGQDPGCALNEAVAKGELDPTRLRSYHRLTAELTD